MSAEITPFKTRLLEAIEHVADEPSIEDALEDKQIAAAEDTFIDIIDESDESDEDLPVSFAIRDVPIPDWNSIVLSKSSKFGDALWDFSEYPHVSKSQVRVNWDYLSKHNINLVDSRYTHWARIVKVLTFYSIPHFSASNFVRSYGSLNSRSNKFRHLVAFFKQHNLYIGEFGQSGFRTINDLSPDTITQFLHSIKPISIRWETAFAFRSWQNLSSGKLIPVEYAILTRVVTKAEISRFRKEYDDQSQPFEPIPMDAYASIISHCIRMVEDYSQDVIWLYDTYYASIVGGYEYSDRAALKPGSLSTTSREGVKAFLEYQPVSHEGKPWWPLHVVKNTSEYGIKYKYGYIFYTGLTSVLASVFDACCVIILATTGMRRSEVMWLHSECVSKDAEGYWLRYEVFKTSNASQGDIKKIPIPDVTAKAVALLERLGREARTYGGTDRLFVNSNMGHFGKSMHSGYPARACKRVSEAVGVDEGVHPHRFRKTLAMYLVYQDPKNIEIVRQLFSHVSLKMTLRYVLSLPGLNDEMRRIIARQNVDVLIEVLDGALSGRIGGNAGNRLRQSVENSPQFVARLQDKGKETLVQYVESMLDQGIKLLHRTNLAICMKTPGHFEAAPCDAKNDDPATKLHPNLFACDPFNCRFSAFVESNIPALQAEVIFHNKLVGHIYTGVKQKNFSERRIQEVVKRLAELGEAETETFLKQVANG